MCVLIIKLIMCICLYFYVSDMFCMRLCEFCLVSWLYRICLYIMFWVSAFFNYGFMELGFFYGCYNTQDFCYCLTCTLILLLFNLHTDFLWLFFIRRIFICKQLWWIIFEKLNNTPVHHILHNFDFVLWHLIRLLLKLQIKNSLQNTQSV